jgi:hypothetical protein
MPKPWSEPDLVMLRAIAADGGTARDAAQYLDRSKSSVKLKAAALGIELAKGRISRPFTDDDDARLRDLIVSGASIKATADAIGRSPGTVVYRGARLGLAFRAARSVKGERLRRSPALHIETATYRKLESAAQLRGLSTRIFIRDLLALVVQHDLVGAIMDDGRRIETVRAARERTKAMFVNPSPP